MGILAFAHQHSWQIYLSNGLMGVGFGLVFSAMSALIVAAMPRSQTGVASGMNANIRTIGGSMTLISAMRGLVHGQDAGPADAWRRFLDIHLAGLRRAGL